MYMHEKDTLFHMSTTMGMLGFEPHQAMADLLSAHNHGEISSQALILP
uniref:Uncharacterized protein n=1 Tax=Setaria italica TaxID=4555 RepID=K4ANN7_SETIT